MQYQCPRRLSRPLPVFIVFALLLGSTTLAQDHASTGDYSNTGADGKHALTGTVVNSVTGDPIPRALVQLYGGSNASMLTDFSGTFRFEGVQQGSVSLSTRKPGFFSPEELNEGADPQSAVPKPIQVGPNMEPVTLQLVPQGRIVGRVVNVEGESVEGIALQAYQLRTIDGRKQWQARGDATSDEDGRFRVAGLAPGVYALRTASVPALGIAPPKAASTREFGYRALFYPGTSELNSATLIPVRAGQETEAGFSLRAEPLFHISGSIVGVDSTAALGAELLDSSMEFSGALRFRPGQGTFFADVPRGHYTLRVHANNGKESLVGVVSLNVNSDINGLQVPVGPAWSIPVRIRTESVKAPVKREFRFGHEYQQVPAAVALIPTVSSINPREFRSFPISTADTKGNPPQQIRDIEPGTYRVEITPTGRWYVQSATCGSTDLLREELSIAPGEAVPPIDVLLRDDTGKLTGVIQADERMRAAVLLIPENRLSSDVRVAFATTNTEEFIFDAIPPGDYEVFALDRIAGLEYRNSDVLAPYRSRAVHVSVPRGGVVSANVQVIRRGTMP